MKATPSSSIPAQDLAHTGCSPRKFRARNLHQAGRHCVRGDACATAFFNALSAVFPVGEAFMIEALKPWRDRVPEPLASDVAAFIVQEAAHTREHLDKAIAAFKKVGEELKVI